MCIIQYNMVIKTSNVLISQIFKSRQIVLELMDENGYDITGYSNFSVNEVHAMNEHNQLDMLLETKHATSDLPHIEKKKIYISYYLVKTIKPANVHEMIEDLFVLTETLSKNDILYIIIKDNVNETLTNLHLANCQLGEEGTLEIATVL